MHKRATVFAAFVLAPLAALTLAAGPARSEDPSAGQAPGANAPTAVAPPKQVRIALGTRTGTLCDAGPGQGTTAALLPDATITRRGHVAGSVTAHAIGIGSTVGVTVGGLTLRSPR